MKTIKLLLIALLFLGTIGCERSELQIVREERNIQKQLFSTLTVGDKFRLMEYSLIPPKISYMNEYTTTYYIWYEYWEYYVTVYNDTKTVKVIRAIE